jgi:hypothetical protein
MWHVAGDQPNEISIRLAASQMQILQKLAAITLLSCKCFASMLGRHFFKLKHEQELRNFKNIKRPINRKCSIEPYYF